MKHITKVDLSLNGLPVVQQVDTILRRAVEFKASDIHFEPYETELRVRLRIDGVLQTVATLAERRAKEIASRVKVLASLDIAEKRRPQDGRIRLQHEGRDVDFRVSVLPTGFGEKVVLRILDKSALKLDLETLGFQAEELSTFRQAISQPYGIILVTGPTGCGKTTTLYAALNELNSDKVNITTVEDPIEFDLPGINQVRARPDLDFSFAEALRSMLRQDPDIIMVGEIRDAETAQIAVRSALTGHLVLSTLHTNDAPSAIARLADMGVERYLLSSSMRLVMAQRLVRTLCTHCRRAGEGNAQTTTSLLSRLGLEQGSFESSQFFEAVGCELCNGSGYASRIAVFELMPVDTEMAEMISEGVPTQALSDYASQHGMKYLRKRIIDLMLSGRTSALEVLRVVG